MAIHDREAANPMLVVVGQPELDPGMAGEHRHRRNMLSWAESGTFAVHAGGREWLVPPSHGMWMPAGVLHSVEIRRPGRGRVVIFVDDHGPTDWREPTGVAITPLIAELIVHLDENRRRGPLRGHAESLLLGLLEPVPNTVFDVPIPADDRVRRIADALIAEPADPRDLDEWAFAVNAGVRTISRLFSAETGLTFNQWRTRVRVRAAIGHLSAGASVGTAARAVGYRKPAAFAEAFRRLTGQPPSIYQGGAVR
ncbi:AraC family transcriptional regulator [Saccharopolyspora sp. TS4A08]|uniref:AraC family transcriptional regulator n=1 Tax=Saccharopolyspora ipomoeae TaxID=3042027 RepID=A0ABT6PIJ7_9PSEU|nr:AraC family transcriptional regulator [Saccharopolyspora sp. TS4A08]MDI2027826.1 AraC family transcriptional regulator [Saccharopolyspora sp. TS4A08]